MKYLRRMMWSLALVAAVIFSNAFVQTIQASEVLSYTQTASLTKDNQAVTSGTTVLTNEKLSATINVAFPDTQAIQAGDTLTLALPKELTSIQLSNLMWWKKVKQMVRQSGKLLSIQQTRP